MAAIEDRPPRENEPAEDGHAGQDRRDRVTKQYGGPDGRPEGREIRRDVVDGGDESLVHHMGDSYEEATREGHGQEDADHGRSLAETPPDQPAPTVARAEMTALGRAELASQTDRGIR